mmetsp:Transcript_39736/g.73248  ORF Transcript_39736/g.73248 Transcript_39736/m.73248 type:complete len:92 (+) Transcript_39736:488-763(+)
MMTWNPRRREISSPLRPVPDRSVPAESSRATTSSWTIELVQIVLAVRGHQGKGMARPIFEEIALSDLVHQVEALLHSWIDGFDPHNLYEGS